MVSESIWTLTPYLRSRAYELILIRIGHVPLSPGPVEDSSCMLGLGLSPAPGDEGGPGCVESLNVMRLWLWRDLSVPLSFSLAGPGAPAWGPPPLTSAGPRSPGKLSM